VIKRSILCIAIYQNYSVTQLIQRTELVIPYLHL